MTDDATQGKLRVLVVGGGLTALETLLALRDMAPDRVSMTVLAPDSEFVCRPMTVREPFAYSAAARYPLATIVADIGAELVQDKLDWVDAERRVVHTESGAQLEYDALVLALGASIRPRYEHAVTIDDRRMDEALHGLIQDMEGGYLTSIAFVSPGRMAWPLPLYELALMTAGRAYDMEIELEATLVTPEERPLAIFGREVSDGVAALLEKKGINTITDAYVEIPKLGEIVIHPGDRRLAAQRAIALPELYGPAVRGLPVSEHGFIRVDSSGQVPDSGPVYAVGDAVDFPIKHGGVGSQRADCVAEVIAARAGADIQPRPFEPEIYGVLLTDEKPRYIHARLTGGQGFQSEFSETPIEGHASKISARYVGPYLERLAGRGVAA